MKNSFRFFLSVYIGCGVSFLLSFAWGEKGLQALHTLAAYETELEINISRLKKQNTTLSRDLKLLEESENSLLLQTRVLGYHTNEEGIIRVSGVEKQPRQLDFGTIYSQSTMIPPGSKLLPGNSGRKILGLCTALAFFLLTGVIQRIFLHGT